MYRQCINFFKKSAVKRFQDRYFPKMKQEYNYVTVHSKITMYTLMYENFHCYNATYHTSSFLFGNDHVKIFSFHKPQIFQSFSHNVIIWYVVVLAYSLIVGLYSIYSAVSTSIIPSPAVGGKESYSVTIYDIQNQFIGKKYFTIR